MARAQESVVQEGLVCTRRPFVLLGPGWREQGRSVISTLVAIMAVGPLRVPFYPYSWRPVYQYCIPDTCHPLKPNQSPRPGHICTPRNPTEDAYAGTSLTAVSCIVRLNQSEQGMFSRVLLTDRSVPTFQGMSYQGKICLICWCCFLHVWSFLAAGVSHQY